MKSKAPLLSLAVLGFLFTPVNIVSAQSSDHDVSLHVNAELGSCDFDIAPELTQAEWKQATREIGNAIYLNGLRTPAPLGKNHWSLFIDYNTFHVDDESGAWNNTFHHPDSTHYLTGESDRLAVPGLRFQYGITQNWDAGIYYTSAKPFGANYGFLGVETNYAFFRDTTRGFFLGARGSYTCDANIKDFNIFSTGFEITASKRLFNYFYPYCSVAANWNHGRIVSNEVSLTNENNLNFHGVAGLDFRWKFLTTGYEVCFGDGASNRAFKIGVIF